MIIMSDFLSNFSNKNYKKLVEEKEKEQSVEAVTEVKEETQVIASEVKKPQAVEDSKDKETSKPKRKAPKKASEIKASSDRFLVIPEQTEEDILAANVQKVEGVTLVDYNINPNATSEIDVIEEAQPETLKSVELLQEESIKPTEPLQEKTASDRRVDFEEETEIDTSYKKKKMIKYGIIAGSTVFILASIFGIFFLMNRVEMPDYVNKPFSEAKAWALKNRIEIEATQEFSLEFDENRVISQSVAASKGVQKGSVIQMTVSKGADPDGKLPLPDFATMSGSAIEEWITKNRATSLKVVKEFNETEPSGKFLRLEFKSPTMTKENYIRKEGATVYISKGKEVFEKNIEVPDFFKKPKSEVETWVATNKIKMTYEEVPSDTVQEGQIVSQSVAAKAKVAKEDEMTVQVSLGKAVTVPWFGSMTKEDAMEYKELQVTVKEYYSSWAAYGDLIEQSIPDGTSVTGANKAITVVYSLGRPYIDDLTTMTEKDLAPYFYDFKLKNAEITYKVHYVNSSAPKGSVVSASKQNEFVSMYEHVDVYVSRG